MALTPSQRTAIISRFQSWLEANRPEVDAVACASALVAFLDRMRLVRQATGQSVLGRWDAWYSGVRTNLTTAQRTACEAHIDGN